MSVFLFAWQTLDLLLISSIWGYLLRHRNVLKAWQQEGLITRYEIIKRGNVLATSIDFIIDRALFFIALVAALGAGLYCMLGALDLDPSAINGLSTLKLARLCAGVTFSSGVQIYVNSVVYFWGHADKTLRDTHRHLRNHVGRVAVYAILSGFVGCVFVAVAQFMILPAAVFKLSIWTKLAIFATFFVVIPAWASPSLVALGTCVGVRSMSFSTALPTCFKIAKGHMFSLMAVVTIANLAMPGSLLLFDSWSVVRFAMVCIDGAFISVVTAVYGAHIWAAAPASWGRP